MDEQQILIFDVETTGTDKKRDQIIELCAQFGLANSAQSRTWRIRPDVEIQDGAREVHGISMSDLEGAPSFAEVADELRELFVEARMLVGYNLRFDIDMLQAEYKRLKQPALDLSNAFVVDPYRLWQRCEPRSLMDAHKRFVGSEFEEAHSASADVAATGRVLLGMVESFDLGSDWDEVADICEPERGRWIGGSAHLQWSDAGDVVLGFGKHSGGSLSALAAGANSGYVRWLIGSDFPDAVRDVCEQALVMDGVALALWVSEAYPRRNAPSPGSTATSSGEKLAASKKAERDDQGERTSGQQELFF